jgi:site-specific recombinase XerD
MIEELQLRNLSPRTKEAYVSAVERFARYCHQSPERLGPEPVRQYLLHLINDNHASGNTVLVQRAALRFLYVSTLKQKWFDDEIARPKRRRTLPAYSAWKKSPAFSTTPTISNTGRCSPPSTLPGCAAMNCAI